MEKKASKTVETLQKLEEGVKGSAKGKAKTVLYELAHSLLHAAEAMQEKNGKQKKWKRKII